MIQKDVSASKQQRNRPKLYSEAIPLKVVAIERERIIKDNGAAKIKVLMFEIGGYSDNFFSGSSMEIDDIWSEVVFALAVLSDTIKRLMYDAGVHDDDYRRISMCTLPLESIVNKV
eukprot:Gb_36275 [translate_table: standard]